MPRARAALPELTQQAREAGETDKAAWSSGRSCVTRDALPVQVQLPRSFNCHTYLYNVGPIVLDVQVHVGEQVRPHILAAGYRLCLAHKAPDGQIIQVQLHSTGEGPLSSAAGRTAGGSEAAGFGTPWSTDTCEHQQSCLSVSQASVLHR